MCCGETSSAPVPTDVLRLCIKSSHDRKPVDILVNLDRRDAIDVAAVLMGGMSSLAQVDAAVAFAIDETSVTVAARTAQERVDPALNAAEQIGGRW